MSTSSDDILRLFARALAPLVAAELREADVPTFFSTEAGCWPPRCRNRRQARDRIRAVTDHEQLGRGRSTHWRVSVAAFRAHHVTPVSALAIVPTLVTDEMIADAAIEAAGLRKTRRAAG